MIKYIDSLPVKELEDNYKLRRFRKYLTHIWKHHNHRRFMKGSRRASIDDKVKDRCVYLGSNGQVHIGKQCPSSSYINGMLLDINDLIKYICTNSEEVPF